MNVGFVKITSSPSFYDQDQIDDIKSTNIWSRSDMNVGFVKI